MPWHNLRSRSATTTAASTDKPLPFCEPRCRPGGPSHQSWFASRRSSCEPTCHRRDCRRRIATLATCGARALALRYRRSATVARRAAEAAAATPTIHAQRREPDYRCILAREGLRYRSSKAPAFSHVTCKLAHTANWKDAFLCVGRVGLGMPAQQMLHQMALLHKQLEANKDKMLVLRDGLYDASALVGSPSSTQLGMNVQLLTAILVGAGGSGLRCSRQTRSRVRHRSGACCGI
ncbi:hypothetical protein BBO_07558 [Beauveria brongniartii RCEF 3172]|uniref:Uncharacterized protein n=1 Tax=Beauveria brongniartii RCEF 3172 TaxID=1081107 RepID=A0A166Z3X2_9HYPO|nr:hypothetical protein BBO_07558 [Beauveria brongniartii RCEF 3172]